MTTPFRFIDDNDLIIPRRRFGQPPSERGRRHGAVVLTGLPAVQTDDVAETEDIAEPPENTSELSAGVVTKHSRPQDATREPIQQPQAVVVPEPPRPEPPQPELVPSVAPRQTDKQRRFDTRHAPAPSAETVVSRRSEATTVTPKSQDLVGRWVSVLLTTLAIVGAILFLAGLLSGKRQPGSDAPMSDWNTESTPPVVVTGTSAAPESRPMLPNFAPSEDELPTFNDLIVEDVERNIRATSEFRPEETSPESAGQQFVEASVADMASSLTHPEPTLATAELPVHGPEGIDPEITLHQQLLEGQSVLSENVPQGIDEFVYPTTDPSTYRASPTTESTSAATPQQPGTARLDGSIHKYRRPR